MDDIFRNNQCNHILFLFLKGQSDSSHLMFNCIKKLTNLARFSTIEINFLACCASVPLLGNQTNFIYWFNDEII
jgi:hypothetical protein